MQIYLKVLKLKKAIFQNIFMRFHHNFKNSNISFTLQICVDLKSKEISSTFKKAVSRRENLETLGGMSEASSEGTTHSVRHEEQVRTIG